MSAIESGAIDCDVHVEPPSMDVLLGYIAPYWHEFIRGGRLGIGHRLYPESEPTSARPEARATGSFPPHTYEELRAQLLDPYEPIAAILTCVATFRGSRNPYFEAAMTTAINNWMRAEFLDRDDRLRGSVVVPSFHPDAAAGREVAAPGPHERLPRGDVVLPAVPGTREQRRAGVHRHLPGPVGNRPRRERPEAQRTELVRAPVADGVELVIDPEDSDRLAVDVDDLPIAVLEVRDPADDDLHALTPPRDLVGARQLNRRPVNVALYVTRARSHAP
jgi:hypothetical protein